ncbi:MAG: RDD family protein [Clostridia bacterium]|nr:RDD family protein [Clostridia bacterium]
MTDLQKASLWKRISAALFDFILLCILVVGAAAGLSAALNYDGYVEQVTEAYEKYGEEYGVDLRISKEEFEKLSEAEQENYLAANKAINADEDAVRAYRMYQHLPLLTITFSVLFGILIMQVLIPVLLGNGQSLGKKIFGIALMRIDGVRMTTLQLFVRSVLGKFAVELMIPIFIFINLYWFGSISIVGIAVLLLLLISQIICLAVTRTGSLLHDVMAGTVAVDMASQMIFETKEAQLEYIKKLHAQHAVEAAY